MKSQKSVQTIKTFTLELSEAEANQLRALVQNPVRDDDESTEESDFRLMIFNALS